MIQKTGSRKSGSVLLIVGGVFQALIAFMHAAMFFGIAKAPALPAAIKPSIHIFNAAVLAAVLFFAYVSFFRRKELIQSGLGRATCLFIGVFYIQRGLVEVVVRGLNLGFFSLLCLIGALYLLAPFTPQFTGRRATQASALEGASTN